MGTTREHLHQWLRATSPDPAAARGLAGLLARARTAGARPFEIVAGAPFRHVGPRLTLDVAGAGPAVAEALALADHPWGAPDWLGLRLDARGRPLVKPYHRARRGALAGLPPLPAALPPDLRPVMAARWDDGDLGPPACELYLRRPAEGRWRALAAEAAALAGRPVPDLPFRPLRREGALGLGLRWRGERVVAVSLFLGAAALPPDTDLARAWAEDLDPGDRPPYVAALAAATLAGVPDGALHAGVTWTLSAAGGLVRAASVRVLPALPERPPLC